ncbi:amino acid adenylation domain-containing protein [Salinispora oceanensis]|uniref:amino acid adenylation domain-containing protein n=1 Tax=Salinispora oceanensis TaxID=1050199 RepID=UPI0003A056E9|nr:amino acid adenylation domain-containing protein [Salinispora oceanensis]
MATTGSDVIEAANSTEVVFPDGESLLHLPFYSWADRGPDRIAVVHPGGTLTYGELRLRADALADALRERGIGHDDIVAIALDKGWEQVVAAIGVLAVGAVFVPVEPNFPTERFHYLLDHSTARCVVTHRDVEARVRWPKELPRIHVDQLNPLARPSRAMPRSEAAPDDLAYIVYTSGSTGTSKGAMITHRGAVNTILAMNAEFEVDPDDRVMAVSSFTFDLAVYDIFGTLAAGATIVMPPRTPLPDAGVWLDVVRNDRVTVWNSVPTLMEMVVELAGGRGERGRMPTLRVVLLGGDWIDLRLPDRIRALAPNALVSSTGGATEASIWSITYPIGEIDPTWRSIPYGKPLANQRFYIRDEKGDPCPAGEAGELYIGGVGVGAGYWRDPDRTAASFVRDPRTGERLYRTGDQGRYLPDGNIEFLGRKDFQVKIQGFRVELGEVEAALREHPGVKEAAAVARPDPVGDRRLFAYVTARSAELGSDDLREFVRGKLPHYMVPDAVVVLAAMPLTTSGKIDRKALPEVAVAPGPLAVDLQGVGDPLQVGGLAPAAPTGPVEQVLVSIWEDVLGRENLGADSDFFLLNGNSLRALRLIAGVSTVLGVEVSVAQLFDASTPRKFGELLSADPDTWQRIHRTAESLVREVDGADPAAGGAW